MIADWFARREVSPLRMCFGRERTKIRSSSPTRIQEEGLQVISIFGACLAFLEENIVKWDALLHNEASFNCQHCIVLNCAFQNGFIATYFIRVKSLCEAALYWKRGNGLNVSPCCPHCSDHNFYNDANHLAMAEQHNEMQCNHIITTLLSQKAGKGPE